MQRSKARTNGAVGEQQRWCHKTGWNQNKKGPALRATKLTIFFTGKRKVPVDVKQKGRDVRLEDRFGGVWGMRKGSSGLSAERVREHALWLCRS